jgi:resuscitation-promoting factor RpfA
MSELERDPEFEAFLKRRSPMHRRLSDFDHAEPSIELDRLVLSRAREAIESPPQAPVYRTTRWAMPLGVAATILIAFTIVLNIERADITAAKQTASKPATVAAQAPAADLARARSAPAAASEALNGETSVASREADTLRRDAAAESRDTAAELSASVAADSTASTVLADDSPVPRQPQEQEIRAKKAEAPPYLASTNGGIRSLTAAPRTAGSAAAGTPLPAPTPGDVHATAESWLREIARLRAAGKTAEADRELTAFRQAYPAHPGYSLARPPTR